MHAPSAACAAGCGYVRALGATVQAQSPEAGQSSVQARTGADRHQPTDPLLENCLAMPEEEAHRRALPSAFHPTDPQLANCSAFAQLEANGRALPSALGPTCALCTQDSMGGRRREHAKVCTLHASCCPASVLNESHACRGPRTVCMHSVMKACVCVSYCLPALRDVEERAPCTAACVWVLRCVLASVGGRGACTQ